MSFEDDIAILAAAPLFRFFGPDALRLLAFASERRDLADDEILFRAGDPADGAYIVLTGTIRLAPRVAGAAPVEAGPAALIGQHALFAGGTRPSEARAAGPAAVMRMAPLLMRRLILEFPEAGAAMRDALAGDLADLSDGLARIGTRFAAP